MNQVARTLLKFLLIFGIVAGLGLAGWMIREDAAETEMQQNRLDRLEEELQPLWAEKAEWKERDEKWQKKLDKGINGIPCLVLSIDYMDKSLYDKVYMMMAPYGLKATFSLKGGHALSDPDDKEAEYITAEQFQDMLDMGWEYAVSADEVQEDAEEDTDNSYLARLDRALEGLDAQELARPKVALIHEEENSAQVKAGLKERGFTMEGVISTGDYTTIGERTEGLYEISSSVVSQSSMGIKAWLEKAAMEKKSVGISINQVLQIVKDSDEDIVLSKFSSLLNYLLELEDQDLFQVMTYSEFEAYQKQKEIDAVRLTKKYSAFKGEMKQKIAEIEEKEQAVVKRVMETE